jgi:hypothetical protein
MNDRIDYLLSYLFEKKNFSLETKIKKRNPIELHKYS